MSERIRAPREVCRARADAASSCTVTAKAIRVAMDVNSNAKSSRDFSDRSRRSSLLLARSMHSCTCARSDAVNCTCCCCRDDDAAGANCSSASRFTAAIADRWRSPLAYSNSILRADSAIATPSTSPTNSSSRMSVSCAAASSSDATWKETDTERSDPIDVSAPSDAPPAPTSCCPDISQLDARRAAAVAYEMIRPTLLWQLRSHTHPLLVQRLYLETFSVARQPQGKRKRIRYWDVLPSVGTTFGATLGQILAHVARPRESHTRLLRAIRDALISVAERHKHMSGDDALLLGYGLASCSVMRNQQRKLRGVGLRIDARYGNGFAALGACAAVIATHAVLALCEPSAPAYFMAADNLRTTLRVAEERLSQWGTRSQNYTDAEALGAERRALRRAHLALDAEAASRAEAVEVAAGDTIYAIDRFQAQLAVATLAAYPPRRVGHDNQAEMETLARGGAFLLPDQRMRSIRSSSPCPVVVPLSGVTGVRPNTAATGGASSDGSSASWIVSSSSGRSDTSSSEFEVL